MRVDTPVGPLVLLNNEFSEHNTLYVNAGREPTDHNGRKDFDLQVCQMALPVAKSGGFNRIGLTRKGCKTRYYMVAEVEAHMPRVGTGPATGGLRFGNVEEGHPMGINVAPGAHFPVSEHRQAVRRSGRIITTSE